MAYIQYDKVDVVFDFLETVGGLKPLENEVYQYQDDGVYCIQFNCLPEKQRLAVINRGLLQLNTGQLTLHTISGGEWYDPSGHFTVEFWENSNILVGMTFQKA